MEDSAVGSALTGSARAVFRRLVQDGPSTRPQIGAQLGLSRPTMSSAVAELERRGFAERIGVVRGPLGRSASQYRAGPASGHVIAVDAGGTQIRVRVSTLDRRLLWRRAHHLPVRQFSLNEEISRAVAVQVAAAIAQTEAGWGPLRALGIAIPTRVVGAGGDGSETRQNLIYAAFRPPEGVDVVLENNVNCAAVAEGCYGAAQGEDSFAYVQIGLKIGMGLVLDGRLVRGRSGAAGEIGHLSFPFGPGLVPKRGMAEQYLGTESLIARVQAAWPADAGRPPSDTADLLSLAGGGNVAARAHVERHAADIGAVVASCVSVVDPGLVVLGGGLGPSPLLLPSVRATVADLSYHAEIRSSLLGPDATVLGIERLAADHAVRAVMGAEG